MHFKEVCPAPLKSATPPVFVISLFALRSSITCSRSSSSSRSAGQKMFLDWVSGKYKAARLDFFFLFLRTLFGLCGSRLRLIRVLLSLTHTKNETKKMYIWGCLSCLNIQKINLIFRRNSPARVCGALTRLLDIVREQKLMTGWFMQLILNQSKLESGN